MEGTALPNYTRCVAIVTKEVSKTQVLRACIKIFRFTVHNYYFLVEQGPARDGEASAARSHYASSRWFWLPIPRYIILPFQKILKFGVYLGQSEGNDSLGIEAVAAFLYLLNFFFFFLLAFNVSFLQVLSPLL